MKVEKIIRKYFFHLNWLMVVICTGKHSADLVVIYVR